MAKTKAIKPAKEDSLDTKATNILASKEFAKYASEDVIYTGKDEVMEGDIDPIITRFPSLNLMIGIGGLPKGRIVEISGEEGAYKSALAWAIAGDVQREGKLVVWIDAENAVDLRVPKVRAFLNTLEVDYNSVIFVRPETAEQAFTLIKIFAANDDIGLIVYDSIVALSNMREEKAGIEKEDRNTLPMTINKGLRQCSKHLRNSECTLLLINQLRENMDRKGPYDKKWKTTGGKGLNHWCSLRLYAFKKKIKNADKEHIGNCVTYMVEKTRFSSPRENAMMFYYFNKGFNTSEELFELCKSWGILEKRGQKFCYIEDDPKDPQNLLNRKEWIKELKDNDETFDEFYDAVEKLYNEYYDDNAEDDVDSDYDDAND